MDRRSWAHSARISRPTHGHSPGLPRRLVALLAPTCRTTSLQLLAPLRQLVGRADALVPTVSPRWSRQPQAVNMPQTLSCLSHHIQHTHSAFSSQPVPQSHSTLSLLQTPREWVVMTFMVKSLVHLPGLWVPSDAWQRDRPVMMALQALYSTQGSLCLGHGVLGRHVL